MVPTFRRPNCIINIVINKYIDLLIYDEHTTQSQCWGNFKCKMSFQDVGIGSKPTSAAKNPSESQAALFQANTALAAFRRLVDAIGTSKDTPDHRLKLLVNHHSFSLISFSPISFFSYTTTITMQAKYKATYTGLGKGRLG